MEAQALTLVRRASRGECGKSCAKPDDRLRHAAAPGSAAPVIGRGAGAKAEELLAEEWFGGRGGRA